MKSLLTSKKTHLLIILFLTFLAYSNIFQNEFVSDDRSFLLNWPEMRDFHHLPSLLQGTLPEGHQGVYRPLRSLFYLFSYHLFGPYPFGYHLQSLLIHLLCTFLIYFITLQLISRLPLTKNTSCPSSSFLAFLTSLLFGLHPIHTEAVTFITTSFDVIGVVFFLLAFYLYLRSEKKLFYFLSIISALLAFFTYELTLTLPLLIVFYDFCFKKITKNNWKIRAKQYLPYFFLLSAYLFLRFIFETPSRATYLADNFYFTLLAMSKAVLRYISLLLLPTNLSFNHSLPGNLLSLTFVDYNKTAFLAQSFFEPSVLLSLSLLAFLVFIFFRSLKRQPLISFSLGFFFLTLSPVLNFFPTAVLMTERYTYLPSFGFCLLAAYLFSKACFSNYWKKHQKLIRLLLVSLLLILLLFYIHQTYHRNQDWQDELSLWAKTLQQVPHSPLINRYLADAYSDNKNYQKAFHFYQKALQLKPDYAEAYYNLGVTYEEIGNLTQARKAYQKAVSVRPSYARSYHNLARLSKREGKLSQAIKYYQKAVRLKPDYLEAHFNLGNIYLSQKNHSSALHHYQETLRLDNLYLPAYEGLAAALIPLEKYTLAIDSLKKAARLNSSSFGLWNNLAIAYYQTNQTQKALSAWQKALSLKEDPELRKNINLLKKSLR